MTSYLPHRRGRYARVYLVVDGWLLVAETPEKIEEPFRNVYEVRTGVYCDVLGRIVRRWGERQWTAFPEPTSAGCQFRTRREAIEWLFSVHRLIRSVTA